MNRIHAPLLQFCMVIKVSIFSDFLNFSNFFYNIFISKNSVYSFLIIVHCFCSFRWVSRWDSHNSSTSCRLKPCPSLKGFSEANLKVVSDQEVCPVGPNKAKDISSQTLVGLLKWAEAETGKFSSLLLIFHFK